MHAKQRVEHLVELVFVDEVVCIIKTDQRLNLFLLDKPRNHIDKLLDRGSRRRRTAFG